MKRLIISLIFIGTFAAACTETKLRKPMVTKSIPSDTFRAKTIKVRGLYTLYTGYDFTERGNFLLDQKGTKTDSIIFTKEIHSKVKIYRYNYSHFKSIDSMICYKDSVCTINSDVVQLLSQKEFRSGESNFTISKYLYSPKDKLYMANVFFNDSLGILFNDARGQGRTILQYKLNKDYEKLQWKIFLDTAFYKFQME